MITAEPVCLQERILNNLKTCCLHSDVCLEAILYKSQLNESSWLKHYQMKTVIFAHTETQCGCCFTLYPVLASPTHLSPRFVFKCTDNFLIFRKCCKSLLIFEGGLQTVGVVTEHKQQSHWGEGGLWSRRSYNATNRSCFHSESCLLPKPAWFYKCTSHEKKDLTCSFEDEANVLQTSRSTFKFHLIFLYHFKLEMFTARAQTLYKRSTINANSDASMYIFFPNDPPPPLHLPRPEQLLGGGASQGNF